jgi:hypothetical protein
MPPRSLWATPREAVAPLLPHLEPDTCFVEPCAGDGALIRHLRKAGWHCTEAWDIAPRGPNIIRGNALTMIVPEEAKYFITNPPWERPLLHALIEHLSAQLPTWLLFDADWMHTRQSAPYMRWCHVIVSVGRVQWIPGSDNVGFDNSAWYLFDRITLPSKYGTVFRGREAG